MWWPAPDTSRRPVRQRGHAGVTSRVNSPRRRRPGVLAEQLVHEGGGPQRVGDQVRAAPGPRHRDVEEPALLVVGVVALRRRRQHEVDERVGLLLRGEAPPRVPEVEHDRVVGLRPFAAWTVLNSSRSRPRRRARSAARLSRQPRAALLVDAALPRGALGVAPTPRRRPSQPVQRDMLDVYAVVREVEVRPILAVLRRPGVDFAGRLVSEVDAVEREEVRERELLEARGQVAAQGEPSSPSRWATSARAIGEGSRPNSSSKSRRKSR